MITHADTHYHFDWDRILRAFDSGSDFFNTEYGPIVPERELSQKHHAELSDAFLFKIAAILAIGEFGPNGPVNDPRRSEALIRSLEHDGFSLDNKKVILLPTEGAVSHEEEETRLGILIRNSGLPTASVIKGHLQEAAVNYMDGNKDHSSLGESRTLLQAVLDGISQEIEKTAHSRVALPGGTKNRWGYLEANGLLTSDEVAMFGAGWGFLSAGSHPGLPPREQARIGLILSMEFSQVLIMKWLDWRNQHP